MEPQYNEGSRDWQNVFISFSIMILLLLGSRKSFRLERGLRYIHEVPLFNHKVRRLELFLISERPF